MPHLVILLLPALLIALLGKGRDAPVRLIEHVLHSVHLLLRIPHLLRQVPDLLGLRIQRMVLLRDALYVVSLRLIECLDRRVKILDPTRPRCRRASVISLSIP